MSQKGSTVKDPDRTSLPSKLPKNHLSLLYKSSLHFTNILLITDWHENVHGFQAGGVVFVAFVSEASCGVNNASK